MTMVVFSMIFGTLMQIPSDNVPYPIFVYVGLLFWQFFSGALLETSNVFIIDRGIITKIYFPRIILPISSVIIKCVDFAIASVILLGMMIYYGYTPHLTGILIMPVLLAITFIAAVGGGLFFATLNVKYRDVRYVLSFFIQLLLFLTPVIYPTSITAKYSFILVLNPLVGVIQNARAGLLGTAPINLSLVAISFFTSLVFLFISLIYFRKFEQYFADII